MSAGPYYLNGEKRHGKLWYSVTDGRVSLAAVRDNDAAHDLCTVANAAYAAGQDAAQEAIKERTVERDNAEVGFKTLREESAAEIARLRAALDKALSDLDNKTRLVVERYERERAHPQSDAARHALTELHTLRSIGAGIGSMMLRALNATPAPASEPGPGVAEVQAAHEMMHPSNAEDRALIERARKRLAYAVEHGVSKRAWLSLDDMARLLALAEKGAGL